MPPILGLSNPEMDFDRMLSHDRLQLPEGHKFNQKSKFSEKLDAMSAGQLEVFSTKMS